MEIMPKVVRDLANNSPAELRAALNALREAHGPRRVTFIGRDGKEVTIKRVGVLANELEAAHES